MRRHVKPSAAENGRQLNNRRDDKIVDAPETRANMDGMNTAAHVIDKFGTAKSLADLLKIPPTTVRSWRVSGYIPAKHQATIMNAAKRAGIVVKPGDFFGREP